MAKKRVSLRLAGDEVAVVGSRAQWLHLISVYECFADDARSDSERESWLGAAEWIKEWLTRASAPAVATTDEW